MTITIEDYVLSFTNMPWEYLKKLSDDSWSNITLNKNEYTTSKFLLCAQDSQMTEHLINFSKTKQPLIEFLPSNIIEYYHKSGLLFISKVDLSKEKTKCIEKALEYISLIGPLNEAVYNLVGSMHILNAEEGYDVSFSDPEIPFSIFYSVPNQYNEKNILRVSESIIHETMHLQLTLIEKVHPLIDSGADPKFYLSPWKGPNRHARGILHAQYVFKTIYDFYKKLPTYKKLEVNSLRFIYDRCNEIEEQFEQTKNFIESDELTIVGKQFVEALYSSVNSSYR